MKKTIILWLAVAAGLFATACSGGGETLRYTVAFSEEDLLISLAGEQAENPDFVRVLEKAIAFRQQFSEDLVDIFYRIWEREASDKSLAAIFASYENRDRIHPQTENKEVFYFLQDQLDDTRKHTAWAIAARLENYGCRFAKIPLVGSGKYYEVDVARKDRLYFDLKNAEDTAAIAQLIGTRGKLDIYETCTLGEVLPLLEEIPEMQSLTLLSDRPQNAQLCIVKEEDCSQVLTLLHRAKAENEAFKNLIFMPGASEGDGLIPIFILRSVSGRSVLDDRSIVDARAVTQRDQAITLFLDAEGAKIFAQLTRNNIDRQIAIAIDGTVYSAPYVVTAIEDGKFNLVGIPGEKVEMLANILKSGRLIVDCQVTDVRALPPAGEKINPTESP
jgi:SecD/SecF fusion protein